VFCVPNAGIAPDCDNGVGTLQDALTIAREVFPGVADTIRLGPGTFAGGTSGSPADTATTTIIGAGRDQTFIEGSGGTPVLELIGATVSLRDVEVRRTAGDAFVLAVQSSVLERVDVTRTGTGTANVLNYNGPSAGAPTATDIRISRPSGTGYGLSLNGVAENVEINGDAGPYEVSLSGGQLRRAKIRTGAALSGIYVTGIATVIGSSVTVTEPTASALTAVTSGSNTAVEARDNTFVNTAAGATVPAVEVGTFQPLSSTLSVRGVAAQGFAALACAGTGNAAATTIVDVAFSVAPAPTFAPCPAASGYTDTGSETTTPSGPITTAVPAFADLAGGNYKPLAGGNLIDVGDPAPLAAGDPTLDLLGDARLVDGDGDGSALRDVGAIEWQLPVATPTPTPTPSPTPVPPPGLSKPELPGPAAKLLSVKFTGTLKRAKQASSKSLTALKKAPKKGTPLVTAKLSEPVKLTATLARRDSKGNFKNLKGSVSLPAAGKTLLLKPTGNWGGRRLAKGTYKLTLMETGVAGRSVTLKVK
jgi:hypothetical protein